MCLCERLDVYVRAYICACVRACVYAVHYSVHLCKYKQQPLWSQWTDSGLCQICSAMLIQADAEHLDLVITYQQPNLHLLKSFIILYQWVTCLVIVQYDSSRLWEHRRNAAWNLLTFVFFSSLEKDHLFFFFEWLFPVCSWCWWQLPQQLVPTQAVRRMIWIMAFGTTEKEVNHSFFFDLHALEVLRV